MNLQVKNQLEPKIRGIVDYLEDKFNDELTLVVPNTLKEAITGKPDNCIILSVAGFNENIGDRILFDFKIYDDKARIVMSCRPNPLTTEGMIEMNVFNYGESEYKAYYFATNLEVESKLFPLPEGKEAEELWKQFLVISRNHEILTLFSRYAKRTYCPICGKDMVFSLSMDTLDNEFRCMTCDHTADVETMTGIDDYINPFKFIFGAEDDNGERGC